MSFRHYEARVKLPGEVRAAFPRVQIYLSQDGEELRIVIVPADVRFSVVTDQETPEVSWLPDPRFI